MNNEQKNPAEVYAILNDGEELTVTHVDGRTETVKVRKVPIREMRLLGEAWGKEDKEVAVYTGKTDDWVKTLTDESFEAVVERGKELNFLSFKRWFKRQERTLEALGQTTDTVIRTAVKSALEKSANS